MNRLSNKFVAACHIISEKYHKPLYEVLTAETSYKNVCLEVESDGWSWDIEHQRWAMPMGSTTAAIAKPVPEPAPIFQAASIRIMAGSERDSADMAYYVVEALKQCGFIIDKNSGLKPNRDGDGFRVYLEVRM